MKEKYNKKTVVGIDIGGSKINLVLWDGRKIIDRWHSRGVSLAKLKAGLDRFPAWRVGIGLAGILDFKTGRLLDSPNLRFLEGLVLKKLFGRQVRFDNDVKCFLRAETKIGAARSRGRVLAVALGTGIGGGIMFQKGQLYRGWHSSEAEFGEMVIDAGKTWEKLYQASQGRPAYQKKLHAQGLANLVNIFDPEIIVLGGRGALTPDRKLLEKLIVSPLAKKIKIVPAKLGNDAVAIGAALLWDDKK
ncbi:MAG: hypothetical protein C3F02_01565 [Parcubacteria group bacterium]|nr:MAG: hypothetical protein C3F02_01565 [Parcubacteria group bacterium]